LRNGLQAFTTWSPSPFLETKADLSAQYLDHFSA
jgi:hypothetical protein